MGVGSHPSASKALCSFFAKTADLKSAVPADIPLLTHNGAPFGRWWCEQSQPTAKWAPFILRVMASRVENRRSNCSLPVVSRLGFRHVTSVRFGLVLFPVRR